MTPIRYVLLIHLRPSMLSFLFSSLSTSPSRYPYHIHVNPIIPPVFIIIGMMIIFMIRSLLAPLPLLKLLFSLLLPGQSLVFFFFFFFFVSIDGNSERGNK